MFVRTSTPSAPSPAGVDAVFAFTCLPWSRAPSDPSPIPQANCYAERFIPSVHSECLDRLLIYHRTARPHRPWPLRGQFTHHRSHQGSRGHDGNRFNLLTVLLEPPSITVHEYR